MRLGPFVLQGMFLKRQQEVSEEFAECLTEKLFTSESLWHHMLTLTLALALTLTLTLTLTPTQTLTLTLTLTLALTLTLTQP